MKFIKLFIALALFVSCFTMINSPVQSQVVYTKTYYDAGISHNVKVTLDSLVTSYTSPKIDWTIFDGQTIYVTLSYVQDGFDASDGSDTCIIVMKGTDGLGTYINVDTVSSGLVSYETQSKLVTQVTLTPTAVMPVVQFVVAHKNTGTYVNHDNGVLYITMYSKAFDVVPPRNSMQWK